MTKKEFSSLKVGDEIEGARWDKGTIIKVYNNAELSYYMIRRDTDGAVGEASQHGNWTIVASKPQCHYSILGESVF
jgi:hypothetical protein